MGLVQFGMIMIAPDLAFLKDREYKQAYDFVILRLNPFCLKNEINKSKRYYIHNNRSTKRYANCTPIWCVIYCFLS